MRQVLMLCFLFYSFLVNGQDCKDYYYFNPEMKVGFSGFSMVMKGKSMIPDSANYTLEYEELKSNQGNCESKLVQKAPTNKKKTKSIELTFNYLMSGDTLKMPINNWMGVYGAQKFSVKTDKENDNLFVAYPEKLTVGQTFEDMKGRKTGYDSYSYLVKMIIEFTNRKVEKKETLTTPAGIWEAYKITYNYKITFLGAPGSRSFSGSFEYKWEEWFVPKFGIVKINTYAGEGLLASTTISSVSK